MGWKMGFEPTTNGTTIHYSNQLSYIHRLSAAKIKIFSETIQRFCKNFNSILNPIIINFNGTLVSLINFVFLFFHQKRSIMEDFILDDPQIELVFQEIVKKIKTLQNGNTAASMKKRGLVYKVNYGASIVSLQEMASKYTPNHLLAFKLWNKQWRETMIMATLLEEPEKVTENQMDFWVKNFPAIEIAEQAVMNLFVRTKFAFEKAHFYCLGKKHIMKITGLLMIGRLAMEAETMPDDQFDPFFELMSPLSKDPQLSTTFIRAFTRLGMRNSYLRQVTLQHANILKTIDSEVSKSNALEIIRQLEQ
jgi:hypothetical protein